MDNVRGLVESLIFQSCLLLDEERFDDYIALWAPDGQYRITTWSPDLRQDLVFLDLGLHDFQNLLEGVNNHQRMLGQFSRHLTGQLIDVDGKEQISVMSSLLVTHTDLEGISKLFAVGRYVDKIELVDGKPLIGSREVRLSTRQFGPGSHIPI